MILVDILVNIKSCRKRDGGHIILKPDSKSSRTAMGLAVVCSPLIALVLTNGIYYSTLKPTRPYYPVPEYVRVHTPSTRNISITTAVRRDRMPKIGTTSSINDRVAVYFKVRALDVSTHALAVCANKLCVRERACVLVRGRTLATRWVDCLSTGLQLMYYIAFRRCCVYVHTSRILQTKGHCHCDLEQYDYIHFSCDTKYVYSNLNPYTFNFDPIQVRSYIPIHF